ncbi:1-deoxy-D-xylulose-5-phosphate reductoisomerase [Vallitalea guaymasensis]|uniref:1-deoxy-D-xylulose 5-phosphate reductoisomerase n=1 Tax=Vallitalea guaymasensis TaxID=1185412 RepID=A0A8J8SE24_9FIRM|nr:1-deoxy-D-xylulose-5-phosphate reductoisomerase [Vallitalea guaymasensis]QUH31478.1 1-deoxy-D-xylulose-5-phosphate reductoisomerase [Vallitalea guaymasensis]
MKKISILGSTGSIGKQTIDIVCKQNDIQILGLTANTNIDLLEKQIELVKPQVVAVMDEQKASILKKKIGSKVEVLSGMDGLIRVATLEKVDIVVTAVVGMIGIRPTVEAIKASKDIALANKETLVTAGQIIMDLIKEYKVNIFPVDSEHSAIFQSLKGENKKEVSKILLTASGGPFRGKNTEQLKDITKAQALNHPNWSMGPKITIDSATLMNKGLEVIEAKWLFDVAPDQIQVVVHPQSIIHSMVEYNDGSVIAQLGVPDMRIPIQYALNYPRRVENNIRKLDLFKVASLTFEEPDIKTFRCLELAYRALEEGGSILSVLNAANELAVKKFLEDKVRFLEIPEIIEYAMDKHCNIKNPSLTNIFEAEKETYEIIESKWG